MGASVASSFGSLLLRQTNILARAQVCHLPPKAGPKTPAASTAALAPRKPAPLTSGSTPKDTPPAMPAGPLFRREDWIAFIISTVVTLLGYLF